MLAFEFMTIGFIQSLGEWLYYPMRFFSFLGQEECYMIIIPLVYWCVDSSLGLRVFVMLLLSNWVNMIIKLSFHLPRPYWVDKGIAALGHETSFGFPSGHAQISTSVYGLLAANSKRRYVWVLVIIVLFFIGLSRLFLGVHFLQDVLGGWLVGSLLVWAFKKIEVPIGAWFKNQTLKRNLLYALLTSIVLLLVPIFLTLVFQSTPVPTDWVQNALVQHPDELIDPYNLEGGITLAGTWLGVFCGAAWLYHRQGGFQSGGTLKLRILRYVIGILGLLILWAGLRSIFPTSPLPLGMALRFLRYALVGLWVTAFAPIVFRKLGLAEK